MCWSALVLRALAPRERREIEGLRLAAALALDQRLAHAFHFRVALLFPANEIADQLAVVREPSSLHLGGDPVILLLSHSDGFPNGGHDVPLAASCDCRYEHRSEE